MASRAVITTDWWIIVSETRRYGTGGANGHVELRRAEDRRAEDRCAPLASLTAYLDSGHPRLRLFEEGNGRRFALIRHRGGA